MCLTPPHLIEVPVPSKKNERSYICEFASSYNFSIVLLNCFDSAVSVVFEFIKTQNTFWLPWIISILTFLRVQIRLEDGNIYLRLRTMSRTIYAAKIRTDDNSSTCTFTTDKSVTCTEHVLMRLYPINKSLVSSQSERRTSC